MENEYVKFDPKELEIVDYIGKGSPYLPPIPVYNSPITPRENFRRMVRGDHYLWLPHTLDINYLFPWCVPDSLAREAFRLASAKLGVHTCMVTREA